MATIESEYEWIFDDVQLGIDIRLFREKNELTQQAIADYCGYKDGTAISAIEMGKSANGIPLYKFMRLCAIMDASPMDYFTIQKLD